MDIIYIVSALAYIIGAIPIGYFFAKCKGISDIRKHGSGNIGATNIARVLGKKYFLLIFILDASKAYLFIYLMQPYFAVNYLYIFAGILLFGNGYSIFLQGSGGKGIATLCGLLSALNPYAIPFLFCVWLSTLLLTHTVGIASVVAAIFLPIYVYITMHNHSLILLGDHIFLYIFSLFASSLVLWKHRSNIMTYWNRE